MNQDKASDQQTDKPNKPLVVGIGASAGGLEPLKVFFDSLPQKTGTAFIVIVHLSPEHKSSMAELLQPHTSLKVIQVNEKVAINPDHVYIIPPNKILTVGDDHLELSELGNEDHKPEVVDRLFRSLGEVKGGQSVGIILSGTGSDGSLGLKTIKEHDGFVMAQDPDEAQYGGMPQSAIYAGLVDKVLPVNEMAGELTAYKKGVDGVRISDHPDELTEDKENVLSKILDRVQAETEHDFNHYKRSTVLRRIERRMHVNHTGTLANYLSFLKDHPDEAGELFKDLLITVTNFFRDPEAFEALENEVIPKLFEGKHPDDELRVWVVGCATGEEAYSIAMLLSEQAAVADEVPQIQIFATDVDGDALNVARRGQYPQSIAGDLSEQRLQRFFTKKGHEYQVKEELRGMILFAEHNLLGSPPFSKQDIITCRNLLIYLDRDLQGEVFNLLHYAMKPEGMLFLGSSDSNLEATELFTPVDQKHRIYRQSSQTKSKVHLPDFPLQFDKNQILPSHSWKMADETRTNFDRLHQRLISHRYAPPSVIINENDDVLHAAGTVKQFLEYTDGEPSRNILEMVISPVRRPLRSLLYQAKKDENGESARKQVQVNVNGESQFIELSVHRVKEKNFPDDLRQIVFRKMDHKKTRRDVKAGKKAASNEDSEIIEKLESELKQTKAQLQLTAEDYETSNEELRASNEELQSMNEELQSTTEELETSQEELRSVNEELKTVNQELETKIEQLQQTYDDLQNLMEAIEIAVIFVDRNLRLKRFTAKATDLFNLTSSDEDRPLGHFTHELAYDSIIPDIKQTLESRNKTQKEIKANDGDTYIMRLSPYQTTENKIGGAVVTFMNITDLRIARQELEEEIEQKKELQRQILKINVSERWKLGRQLHDGLGQTLVAVDMRLNSLKKKLEKDELDEDYVGEINELSKIQKETVDKVRNLSHEMLPIDMEQQGIVYAFNNLAERIKETYDLDSSFREDGVVNHIEDIDIATNLYRIAQEATKNAALHGHADNVHITLKEEDSCLQLTIEDDGQGLESAKEEAGGEVKTGGDGMGIHIMRHRMELMDGTLEIKESSLGEGTGGVSVLCQMPLDGEEE